MMNGFMVRANLIAPFLWCALFFAGCSDVPTAYRVDGGLDPANQDEEVRFRTTYYMRVYETCPVDNATGSGREYENRLPALTSLKQGVPHIIKDSLYRFRMTGQASSLYSNLHFESGVLKANEMDGFGNSINYDDATNRFAAGSRSDKAVSASKGQLWCPNGKRSEQQFILLGPQGVRVLNQDDRLIMAMYTDSKPLIAALKRLAGKQETTNSDARVQFDLEAGAARADKALLIIKEAEPKLEATNPAAVVTRLLPMFGVQPSTPNPALKADAGKPAEETAQPKEGVR